MRLVDSHCIHSCHFKISNLRGRSHHFWLQVLRMRPKGSSFPISSSNDVVVFFRSYHNLRASGSTAGVQMKRKMQPSQMSQLQLEWLLWAAESKYPFARQVEGIHALLFRRSHHKV